MSFANVKGITVASGFKLQAETPLDARFTVDSIADRDELVTINAAYPGLIVYVKNDKSYLYTESGWTPMLAGAMYVHPTTSGNKHLPAGGKVGQFLKNSADGTGVWADIPKYSMSSSTVDGLMSKEDKAKLDAIEAQANKYVHPTTHAASMITQDATHRFVSDTEKATWADKYTKNEIDNKFSTLNSGMDWKEAVNTFNDIATTYPSPADGWTVNVKDTDYTYRYNGTAWIAISANAIPKSTSSVDGLMSKEDKAKLDGIATGANNYVHPTGDGNKHVPANGTTNAGKVLKATATAGSYVWGTLNKSDVGLGNVDNTSDLNKPISTATQAALDKKVDKVSGKGLSTNDFTTAEKNKLAAIAAGANNYVHPSSHPATMITQDASHRFVTDTEKNAWNAKANIMFANVDAIPTSAPAGTLCFVING